MSNLHSWQHDHAFLEASLRWVSARLRLLQAIRGQQATESLLRESETARGEMQRAEEASLAWTTLRQRLGLTDFERDVLLLCAAIELDVHVARQCALLHGNESLQYATFSLAMEMGPQPVWDAMSPSRPLRRWNLIEIERQPTVALTRQPLRIDERVLSFIKGAEHLDEVLIESLHEVSVDHDDALSTSQQEIVASLNDTLTDEDVDRYCVVQMLGPHHNSKRMVARSVCQTRQLPLYEWSIDPRRSQDEADHFVRVLARESLLHPLAIFVQLDSIQKENLRQIQRLATLGQALIFVDCDERISELRSALTLNISKPAPPEQYDAWRAAMDRDDSAKLAGQFLLDLPDIIQITERVAGSQTPFDDAWSACRQLVRPRMNSLAQRIDAKAQWQDIVLPDEQLEQLQQISRQVRHRHRVLDQWGFRQRLNRGFGTTALFAGSPGTGKTMAAEVLANELQLDLFRVDLSAVVSKYIGETEKALRRLLDTSEEGVVLLCDEADALFGKRSEVKDSHDRYANIEVNYLLQRFETFRGIVILATNTKSALDTAFMRRLRFVVDFPEPQAQQRRKIWRLAFPDQTPKTELDLNRLAALHVNGGNIHNIALNAAFSASEQSGVGMREVLDSARAEYIKMQQPVNSADFMLESTGVRQ